MNTRRHFFTALFTMTLAMLGVGCADKIQLVDRPPKQMTVREARAALVESLNDVHSWSSVREVRFTRREVRFKVDNTYATNPRPLDFTLTFTDLGTLSIRVNRVGKHFTLVESDGKRVLFMKAGERDPDGEYAGAFNSELPARAFADALVVLKEAATIRDAGAEEADFAAFTSAARTWLAAELKPPMSDEARTRKALAEDAFKRKDFAAALDAYVEALGMHPMWPEGHYNAALLAAEVEDYEVAARHMRRYLALAPGAKDASAAKEKLLLWQHKAKQ